MSGTVISRRKFVGWVTVGVGAIMSAVVGLPGISYVIGPSLRKQETGDWQPLGPLSQVEASAEPVRIILTQTIEAGWRKTIKKETVYVQQLPEDELLAHSNVCTHLACIVHWEAQAQRFFCPCHDGVYDRLGNVVSGPPPRPLDRYEIKVEDGTVLGRPALPRDEESGDACVTQIDKPEPTGINRREFLNYAWIALS